MRLKMLDFHFPLTTKSKIISLLKNSNVAGGEQLDLFLAKQTGCCIAINTTSVQRELFAILARPHVLQYVVSQLNGRSAAFKWHALGGDVNLIPELVTSEVDASDWDNCLKYALAMLPEFLLSKLMVDRLDHEAMRDVVMGIYDAELRAVVKCIVSRKMTYKEFLRNAEAKYGCHPDKADFHNVG